MEEYIIKNILKNNPGMSKKMLKKKHIEFKKLTIKQTKKEMPKEKNIEENGKNHYRLTMICLR